MSDTRRETIRQALHGENPERVEEFIAMSQDTPEKDAQLAEWKTWESTYRESIANSTARVAELAEKLSIAQEQLAEKDAKLSEMQRELDEQNGMTHALNLAAKVREQSATLARLEQSFLEMRERKDQRIVELVQHLAAREQEIATLKAERNELRRDLDEQNGTTHALNLAAQVRALRAQVETLTAERDDMARCYKFAVARETEHEQRIARLTEALDSLRFYFLGQMTGLAVVARVNPEALPKSLVQATEQIDARFAAAVAEAPDATPETK